MEAIQLDEVDAAVARLAQMCSVVSDELVPIDQAIGRILAQPLVADRDSPATDVSAMDGYAFRLADLQAKAGDTLRMQVCGVARAGIPSISLQSNSAVQIFTGACLPAGADCVVRREDTRESPGQFELRVPLASLSVGQNVRWQGENTAAGRVVLPSGTEISTATVGTLASFGKAVVPVRRKLRVAMLTSGDELIAAGEAVEAWQIRDSNGPTLRSWLSNLRWAELVQQERVKDDLDSTLLALRSGLESCDVLLVTGGVSAGDTDFLPRAVAQLGGQIVFHRLPIKPGRPVLGAVLGSKLIICLPGNPLSTAVTARVIAQPVMERMVRRLQRSSLYLSLANPDKTALSLVWYRLVRLEDHGCRLVDSRGSGDFVSMAGSDGFVRIPPGQTGSGPWQAWLW